MRRAKVTVTIDGKEYVAIPRADYVRITGGKNKDLDGAVDAADYTRRSLGASLRAAREAAGLTQDALAKKIGKAQPMVSAAESGAIHVGERYTLAVLKACGLPKDWAAKEKRRL
jgi:ribosome-binding protein aMBF1 (putative translation factor)